MIELMEKDENNNVAIIVKNAKMVIAINAIRITNCMRMLAFTIMIIKIIRQKKRK